MVEGTKPPDPGAGESGAEQLDDTAGDTGEVDVDALLSAQDEPQASPYAEDPMWRRMQEVAPDDDTLFHHLSAGDPAEAEALRKEWGADARLNAFFAAKAVETFLTPQLEAELKESGLLGSPQLLRAAARIGRQVAQVAGDPLSVGKGATMPDPSTKQLTTAQRDSVDAEIRRLYDENRGRPEMTSEPVQRRLRQLFKLKTGGASVPIATGPRS